MREQAIKKEFVANKEFLIGVVNALGELDSSREKIINSKDSIRSVKEIGKLLEVSAHRGYIDVNKYYSSEYRQLSELSLQLSDIFKQLENYGTQMNNNPDDNFDDLKVVLNDLPKGIDLVNNYLFNKKITLNEEGKIEVLNRINIIFSEEIETYEKFLITHSDKDFNNIYVEDLTTIFMYDILKYGYVRMSQK